MADTMHYKTETRNKNYSIYMLCVYAAYRQRWKNTFVIFFMDDVDDWDVWGAVFVKKGDLVKIWKEFEEKKLRNILKSP